MNILFIGDVFGTLGIKAIAQELPQIKQRFKIDFIIANAENTTECRGLKFADYQQLMSLGINCLTMGNHTWYQSDYEQVLEQENIMRPYNIDHMNPLAKIGVGTLTFACKDKTIRVTNLMGKSAISRWTEVENTFLALEEILKQPACDIHIVDLHTESTSEKNCFLRYFKSQVTAILGTHTHVQTNDAFVSENTAYISDIGMTGPAEGVIGANDTSLIKMFTDKSPFFRLKEAPGKYQFCAVVINIDDQTNLPASIKNIFIRESD